jgi:hypothetical protein
MGTRAATSAALHKRPETYTDISRLSNVGMGPGRLRKSEKMIMVSGVCCFEDFDVPIDLSAPTNWKQNAPRLRQIQGIRQVPAA